MALLWALAVLSLLPLLDAQSPKCANLMTAAPISNTTMDWLSGKWFYIGSAFRNPEYNESARAIQAAFFYFEPRHAEDKLIVREYQTIADKCVYNCSYINVYRQNGTLSKLEMDREHFADLLLSKHFRTFMLAASWNGTKNVGVSFYADKPEVTQEQKKEFLDVIKCIDIQESEIIYTDEKKDPRGTDECPGGKSHWEIREDAWSTWGGLENLTGGEEQSQVVANGKETHPGDDHVQPLPATPQASNACVMGNRSYGFGATPTASLGPLS